MSGNGYDVESREFRLGPLRFLWEVGLFVVIGAWLIALVNLRGDVHRSLGVPLSALIVALVGIYSWRVWNIKVILGPDSITFVNLVQTITLPYRDCVRAKVVYGILTFPTTVIAIVTTDGKTHRSGIRSQWTSLGVASELKTIRTILNAVNTELDRQHDSAWELWRLQTLEEDGAWQTIHRRSDTPMN